jgi:hypothetical protein
MRMDGHNEPPEVTLQGVSHRQTGLGLVMLIAVSVAPADWARALPGPATGSVPGAASADCRTWKLIPSPGSGALQAAGGLSSTDVWAVGDNGGLYPIIQHWDGTSWRQVRQTRINGSLFGVAVVAADDVWAAGYLEGGQSVTTLTEHWDGTRWRRVSSPSPGAEDYLYSASAAGNDVWLAGNYIPKGSPTLQPLYMRWNGSHWRHIKEAPGLTYGGIILSIDVRTSTDAWAVGYGGTVVPDINGPLIEHWDGTAWSVVPSPQPQGGSSALTEVSAVSATDAWAVGYDSRGPLIQHWDGVSWTRVRAPGTGYNLNGVTAISSGDVWAVGSAATSLHWDGTSWSRYGTPAPKESAFASVTAVSSKDVWAVGLNALSTLTVHSKGVCP